MKALVFCPLMLVVSGCDYLDSHVSPPSAPKTVWIGDGKDGETMVACKGDIHISSRDSGYQIDFVDANGLSHVLYGVKRFSLTDVPTQIKSTLPYPEPSLYDFKNNKEDFLPTYSNGKTVHDGDTVAWSVGEAGKLVIERDADKNETNRRWERIWLRNTVCDPSN